VALGWMGSCSPLTPAHLGHRKDEHGLRKLRTAPRDVLQEVTDRVTTALHRHSPGACHPGSQEVRASLWIWWLDRAQDTCLLGPSFQQPVGKEGAGGHWWLWRHASDNEEWALPSSPLPLPVMIRASLWPII